MGRQAAALLLAVALLAASVSAQYEQGPFNTPTGFGEGKEWYKCDPAKCVPPKCLCASQASPGGLTRDQTPQFILVSHDDAITSMANSVIRRIVDGVKNPNGCNAPATWFANEYMTDCKLAKRLYDENHEIASHTVKHTETSSALPRATVEAAIVGVRTFMATCGIPAETVVGFRSPFLVHNPQTRSILAKNGFKYDSSFIDYVGFASPTSIASDKRTWPYTFDNGVVHDTKWSYPAGESTKDERYPGLWEVPLWSLQSKKCGPGPILGCEDDYPMDPGPGFGGDMVTMLKKNFEMIYNGNRTPFPLNLHSGPWATEANVAKAGEFLRWAITQPNVWVVTYSDLLRWMENPVPADQAGDFFTCRRVNVDPPEARWCQVYTVKGGDFMSKIAGDFGADVNEIVALNPGLNPAMLSPGTTLKIPKWNSTCPPQGIPAEGGNDGGYVDDAPKCRTHTVVNGDSLWLIGQKYNTTGDAVAAANQLTAAGLQPGAVLRIPPFPECCGAPGGCPVAPPPPSGPQLPGDRVEMAFRLAGATLTQTLDRLSFAANVLADDIYIISPESAATGPPKDKAAGRRRLASSETVIVYVVPEDGQDPMALYRQIKAALAAKPPAGLSAEGVGWRVFKGGELVYDSAAPEGSALATGTGASADDGSSSDLGLIIGCAVGGVAALAAIAGVTYWVLRRPSPGAGGRAPVSPIGGTAAVAFAAAPKGETEQLV